MHMAYADSQRVISIFTNRQRLLFERLSLCELTAFYIHRSHAIECVGQCETVREFQERDCPAIRALGIPVLSCVLAKNGQFQPRFAITLSGSPIYGHFLFTYLSSERVDSAVLCRDSNTDEGDRQSHSEHDRKT